MNSDEIKRLMLQREIHMPATDGEKFRSESEKPAEEVALGNDDVAKVAYAIATMPEKRILGWLKESKPSLPL